MSSAKTGVLSIIAASNKTFVFMSNLLKLKVLHKLAPGRRYEAAFPKAE
jgi:hypothetical protein